MEGIFNLRMSSRRGRIAVYVMLPSSTRAGFALPIAVITLTDRAADRARELRLGRAAKLSPEGKRRARFHESTSRRRRETRKLAAAMVGH